MGLVDLDELIALITLVRMMKLCLASISRFDPPYFVFGHNLISCQLKEFEGIEFRGGALDGGRLEPEDVKSVAKWPSRAEQLSILSGQISSVGSMLSGQLLSAGGAIAGQLKTRVEELEKAEA